MARQEVYREMEEMFGLVPTFFKSIPDSTLEMEWHLFKQIELGEGAIPNKYRELIGVGIAAATKCRYCTLFHMEAAKMFGATETEITQAVQYAKNSAGWSTWLNGLQFDYEQFKDETHRIVEYVHSMQGVTA
jgi:AhpD family alkylhydroperoxidase